MIATDSTSCMLYALRIVVSKSIALAASVRPTIEPLTAVLVISVTAAMSSVALTPADIA